MHLEIQETSEKVETWFFLLFITVCDGFIHEFLCFHYFVKFYGLVNPVATKRVAIATNNRDNLETVRVFVLREFLPSLCEKLGGHEIVLVVHAQDALA